jgi:type I restriction enzyme M protein
VRGAVDGWDFKQYVLGTLFYRFISENFAATSRPVTTASTTRSLADSVITPRSRTMPSRPRATSSTPASSLPTSSPRRTQRKPEHRPGRHLRRHRSSASGYPSELDIKGLFADFDTTSNRLGNTVKDKNARLAAVLKGVAGLDFGDLRGTATSTCSATPTNSSSPTTPPTPASRAASSSPRSRSPS